MFLISFHDANIPELDYHDLWSDINLAVRSKLALYTSFHGMRALGKFGAVTFIDNESPAQINAR